MAGRFAQAVERLEEARQLEFRQSLTGCLLDLGMRALEQFDEHADRVGDVATSQPLCGLCLHQWTAIFYQLNREPIGLLSMKIEQRAGGGLPAQRLAIREEVLEHQ